MSATPKSKSDNAKLEMIRNENKYNEQLTYLKDFIDVLQKTNATLKNQKIDAFIEKIKIDVDELKKQSDAICQKMSTDGFDGFVEAFGDKNILDQLKKHFLRYTNNYNEILRTWKEIKQIPEVSNIEEIMKKNMRHQQEKKANALSDTQKFENQKQGIMINPTAIGVEPLLGIAPQRFMRYPMTFKDTMNNPEDLSDPLQKPYMTAQKLAADINMAVDAVLAKKALLQQMIQKIDDYIQSANNYTSYVFIFTNLAKHHNAETAKKKLEQLQTNGSFKQTDITAILDAWNTANNALVATFRMPEYSTATPNTIQACRDILNKPESQTILNNDATDRANHNKKPDFS